MSLHNGKRKNSLWISLTLMVLVSLSLATLPVSATNGAVLSAPFIVNQALTPGSDFYIEITVANVSKLWGWEFKLSFDPSVLQGKLTYDTTGDLVPDSAFTPYYPFAPPDGLQWGTPVTNNTGGFIAVAYSMALGETVGFSTVDPAPIGRIDFHVIAFGGSYLDLQDTVLTNIPGAITHDVVDGYFANVVPQWSANLVRRSAWPEHHSWVVSKDPDLKLMGKVANLGNVAVKAKVVFNVTNSEGLWFKSFETPETAISSGDKVDLARPITLADLDNIYGVYYVKAQVYYDSDGDGTTDAAGAKIKSFRFAAKP